MSRLITYISTYGNKCTNEKGGIPIEVGAEGRTNFLYTILDNTGENISAENKYYGDLTALYWIWKNHKFRGDEYIAFRHYNKYLKIKPKVALEYLENHKDGWIVAKSHSNPPHTYIHEWEIFRDIIKNDYPLYYSALLDNYDYRDGSGMTCNGTNMFITSAEQFEKYCDTIFEICKKLREAIGDTDVPKYNQRYCAFMAERFLTIYLEAHKYCKYETKVYRKRWYLGILSKYARRLGINKNNQIVRRLVKILSKNSYRSSYYD